MLLAPDQPCFIDCSVDADPSGAIGLVSAYDFLRLDDATLGAISPANLHEDGQPARQVDAHNDQVRGSGTMRTGIDLAAGTMLSFA